MEIRDRRIWVTGASRGIGRALAEMFAENGAHLTLINRAVDSELIDELKKKGAASVRILKTDLSARKDIDALLKKTEGEEVHCLVNNAGQLTGGLLETQDIDQIYSTLHVNVMALIHLTRGLLPRMLSQEGGAKIVNNASIAALMHFPSASTYAASKAAVMAFTRCLHAELQGTSVSTLLLFTPGVETRMFEEISHKYGATFDLSFIKGMPVSRYAKMVREAILEDLDELRPQGIEGLGLNLAQHLPATFRKLVSLRFRRTPKSE